jgi:predicted TIM-barrel fold metal-dependent hydrolase
MHSPQLALRFIREFGAHRLVFGATDYTPGAHPRPIPILTYLRASELSETDKAAILGENIRCVYSR